MCNYYQPQTALASGLAVFGVGLGGVGDGLGGVGDGGGFGVPPFGQRISRPRYSKYIATHTENTKNPKKHSVNY